MDLAVQFKLHSLHFLAQGDVFSYKSHNLTVVNCSKVDFPRNG